MQSVDFEAFFADTYPSVVRALAFALRDRGAAEDAAQEAFAKAHRKWKAVATAARPAAWVYVVAVRDARRRLDRLDRIEQRAAQAGPRGPVRDPLDGVVDAADASTLLASLSARQRMAVVLRYWADLDEASIAEAMGCARGTVKATLSQALARLRVAVTANGEVCSAE